MTDALSKAAHIHRSPNAVTGSRRKREDAQFDPWRCLASTPARTLRDEVQTDLEDRAARSGVKKRKPTGAARRTQDDTLDTLLANAIHREVGKPGGRVAISLSNRMRGRAKKRYGSPIYNRALPDLVRALAAAGWLNFEVGHQGYFDNGCLSTISAGPRLRRRMTLQRLDFADLGRRPGEEVIVQNSERDPESGTKHWLPYTDNAISIRFRSEAERINAWLAAAVLDYEDDGGRPVDVGDRLVRRIFANDFGKMGRFTGGFWQGLSKKQRRDNLLIDGELTATVDYGQMAVRILYAWAGVEAPAGDAYSIPGLEKAGREGIKKLVNALIHAKHRLRRFPSKTRKYFPACYDIESAIQAIERHHAAIARYFGSDLGLEVFFAESQVMACLLLRLLDQGIVALPIHDAVVVADSERERVIPIMVAAFMDTLGGSVEASVSVIGL